MLIFVKDFPDYITITSSGPAAKKLLFLMGRYKLETDKSAQLKPVYKKTDRDFYIFYSSKLYFILVITVSQLYLSLQHMDGG